jgi:cytochrome P450
MSQSSGKKLLTPIKLIGVGVVAGLLLSAAMNSPRGRSYQTAQTYPTTGIADLLRLAGGFVRAVLSGPRSLDAGLVFSNWINDATNRHGSDNLIVNLWFTRLLLVTGPDLSNHIMKQPPSAQGYQEGPTKARGMSFLAPQALTICHDQQWYRLRPYNERVLSTQQDPDRQQVFLRQVRQAFAGPVSTIDDIRRCMARAMLGIVFGEGVTPEHLAEDVQVLFGYVQNPVRRIALGRKEAGRRHRFYGALRQLWEQPGASGPPSLLADGRRQAQEGSYSVDELLQQFPHWMFTFTGSGTDLLSRTLAMVASRPSLREKVLQEIAQKGPLDQASTIEQLDYLEACLLETCRVFPPVTRTFHVAPQGDVFNNTPIPTGVEIWHYFPVNQRDTAKDPTADHFQPERWLDPASNAPDLYPNLFLSGARVCPGKDLILFVCKAAIATLLQEQKVRVDSPVLSRDPLPFSFPRPEAVKYVTA